MDKNNNKTEEDIFELLNNPPEFRLDRDFEAVNEKISSKLRSRDNVSEIRVRKLNDARFKYAYHTEKKVLHDRKCKLVKEIPDEYFEMCVDNDEGMKICRLCKMQVMLRQSVDKQSDVELLEKFFKRAYAGKKDVIRLLSAENAKIRYVTFHTIEIKVRDDKWLITINRKTGKLDLRHNNYSIRNGERIIEEGFHEQQIISRRTFSGIRGTILGYNNMFHIKKLRMAAREEQKEIDGWLEMAPDNQIKIHNDNFNIKTAVKLKRFSLIYNRYLFVDTKARHYKKIMGKKKIPYRIISEKFSQDTVYGIIMCDIPKWHRKKIHSVMNKVKKSIYGEGHGRAYLCGNTMRRYLDKKGIRYNTYL